MLGVVNHLSLLFLFFLCSECDLLLIDLRLLQKAQNRLLQCLVRGVRSYHNHGRLPCHRYSASISRIRLTISMALTAQS